MKTKIAISIFCGLLTAAHLIWPDLQIDITALVLVVVAILPWLAGAIRSVELPGGFKIELHDVKTATEKVTSSKVAPSSEPGAPSREENLDFLREIAISNPNLALVGLRIEIERRLSQLAQLAQLPSARRSTGAILRDLVTHQRIDRQITAGLADLIALGNQAAHGANVSADAATWALDTSPLIFELLDSLITRKENSGEAN